MSEKREHDLSLVRAVSDAWSISYSAELKTTGSVRFAKHAASTAVLDLLAERFGIDTAAPTATAQQEALAPSAETEGGGT